MLPTDLRGEDLTECRVAHALFEAGRHDEAIKKAEPLLQRHPDDIFLTSVIAEAYLQSERWGIAFILHKRLVELGPGVWQFWNNLGRCHQMMVQPGPAMTAFRRALLLAPDEFAPYRNVAAMLTEAGRFDDAWGWLEEASKRAQKPDDLLTIERHTHRILLARREWKEGWRCFDLDLGTKYRPNRCYQGEPEWDGSPGQKVIIYGEQGLGDEVMFASMYPDAIRDCKSVVLECDNRLVGLFRRSFPEVATVYGTRHDSHRFWTLSDRADARCAAGTLGGRYRGSGQFPRTPYLVADPVRRKGYRAILDGLPGRKVGIAWTGGLWNTLSVERSLGLAQLWPILERPGCTFISLQYKFPADLRAFGAATGVKIHHWKHAVQSKDYDDAAALVAELDVVVSVTTAVALLAGALGVETHVLVPPHPTWHWAQSGEMPWLPVHLYRREGASWEPAVRQIAEKL